MNDEPSELESAVTDAAKAVQVASAGAKVLGWCAPFGRFVYHSAAGVHVTSRRWALDGYDFVRAHRAAWMGALGGALCVLAQQAETYIFPVLRSQGFWGVIGAAAGCTAANLIYSLCRKGAPPVPPGYVPPPGYPPMPAVPPPLYSLPAVPPAVPPPPPVPWKGP